MYVVFNSLLLSVILTFKSCYSATSVSFVRVENSAEIQALNNLGIFTAASVTYCASICAKRGECDAYSFNRDDSAKGTCTLMQITLGSSPSETIGKISGLYMKAIPKPMIAQTDPQFTTEISTLTSKSNDPEPIFASPNNPEPILSSPNGLGSTTSSPNNPGFNTFWPDNPGFNAPWADNTGFNDPWPDNTPMFNNLGPNTLSPNMPASNTKPPQTPQTSSPNGPRNLSIQCTPSSGQISALMTVLNGASRVTYIFFKDGTVCNSVNGSEICEKDSERVDDVFEYCDLDGNLVQMAFSTDSQRIILGDGEKWYWYILMSNEISFKKTIDDVGQCKSWLSGFISGSIFNSTAIMIGSNGDISCYPQTTLQQSLDSNNCQALQSPQSITMCTSIQSALQSKNIENVDAIEEQNSGILTVVADATLNCKISN